MASQEVSNQASEENNVTSTRGGGVVTSWRFVDPESLPEELHDPEVPGNKINCREKRGKSTWGRGRGIKTDVKEPCGCLEKTIQQGKALIPGSQRKIFRLKNEGG